jgi:hypothetical protein
MSEEPKPCPFCRSEAQAGHYMAEGHYYQCSNTICGLIGPFGMSQKEALAAWDSIAVVPEGWRVVPENADEKQVRAMQAKLAAFGHVVIPELSCMDSYHAGVAAAPKPEDGQE